MEKRLEEVRVALLVADAMPSFSEGKIDLVLALAPARPGTHERSERTRAPAVASYSVPNPS